MLANCGMLLAFNALTIVAATTGEVRRRLVIGIAQIEVVWIWLLFMCLLRAEIDRLSTLI